MWQPIKNATLYAMKIIGIEEEGRNVLFLIVTERERDDNNKQDDSRGLPFFIMTTTIIKGREQEKDCFKSSLSVDLLPQGNTCLGLGISKECNQMILPQYATSPPPLSRRRKKDVYMLQQHHPLWIR